MNNGDSATPEFTIHGFPIMYVLGPTNAARLLFLQVSSLINLSSGHAIIQERGSGELRSYEGEFDKISWNPYESMGAPGSVVDQESGSQGSIYMNVHVDRKWST